MEKTYNITGLYDILATNKWVQLAWQLVIIIYHVANSNDR